MQCLAYWCIESNCFCLKVPKYMVEALVIVIPMAVGVFVNYRMCPYIRINAFNVKSWCSPYKLNIKFTIAILVESVLYIAAGYHRCEKLWNED